MLDWDALIPAGAGQNTGHSGAEAGHVSTESAVSQDSAEHRNWDKVSHPVPAKTGSVPPRVGQLKPSNGAASSGFFASVPVVPLKKQGRGKEEEEFAGAAAVPQHLRAVKNDDEGKSYPAHPAAVLLLMAWSRYKRFCKEERAGLLLDLETLPPAEQVRHWHGVCLADGLKPWQVLCLPASMSGADCTRCKHLTTKHEAIGEDRQRYHWACSLGYLILEHGRGTERLWIAPPECKSFERWYPAQWR